jgi:cation transport protein ChaC
MALTAALIARIAREVEDAGPSPGAVYLTDEDYDIAVRDILAQGPPGDVWLFGYGSLLWKPAFEHVESRMATVRGWHRSFCIRVARFRGTRDLPGLMMALDRGGQCRGKVFRIPADRVQAVLKTLFQRELVVKPPGTPPRWLMARTNDGPLRALGFVVDRRSPFYSGRLAPEEVADIVSRAAGHWGSCAEYLHNTVSHLEALGIHDRNLWRLQALVAEKIGSSCAPSEQSEQERPQPIEPASTM